MMLKLFAHVYSKLNDELTVLMTERLLDEFSIDSENLKIKYNTNLEKIVKPYHFFFKECKKQKKTTVCIATTIIVVTTENEIIYNKNYIYYILKSIKDESIHYVRYENENEIKMFIRLHAITVF